MIHSGLQKKKNQSSLPSMFHHKVSSTSGIESLQAKKLVLQLKICGALTTTVARKYLALSRNSLLSEQLFSKAGLVVSSQRA